MRPGFVIFQLRYAVDLDNKEMVEAAKGYIADDLQDIVYGREGRTLDSNITMEESDEASEEEINSSFGWIPSLSEDEEEEE